MRRRRAARGPNRKRIEGDRANVRGLKAIPNLLRQAIFASAIRALACRDRARAGEKSAKEMRALRPRLDPAADKPICRSKKVFQDDAHKLKRPTFLPTPTPNLRDRCDHGSE